MAGEKTPDVKKKRRSVSNKSSIRPPGETDEMQAMRKALQGSGALNTSGSGRPAESRWLQAAMNAHAHAWRARVRRARGVTLGRPVHPAGRSHGKAFQTANVRMFSTMLVRVSCSNHNCCGPFAALLLHFIPAVCLRDRSSWFMCARYPVCFLSSQLTANSKEHLIRSPVSYGRERVALPLAAGGGAALWIALFGARVKVCLPCTP